MAGVSPDPRWKDGEVDGCVVRSLRLYRDDRGWLGEIFRNDELGPSLAPAMAYVSLTRSGTARGPHAHLDQTDHFAFFDGRFRVWLWDTRPDSATFGVRAVHELGEDRPAVLVVPPGVAHAYRNVSGRDALIVNCPNRLYGGPDRAGPVDEIRYEDDPSSPFRLDD